VKKGSEGKAIRGTRSGMSMICGNGNGLKVFRETIRERVRAESAIIPLTFSIEAGKEARGRDEKDGGKERRGGKKAQNRLGRLVEREDRIKSKPVQRKGGKFGCRAGGGNDLKRSGSKRSKAWRGAARRIRKVRKIFQPGSHAHHAPKKEGKTNMKVTSKKASFVLDSFKGGGFFWKLERQKKARQIPKRGKRQRN